MRWRIALLILWSVLVGPVLLALTLELALTPSAWLVWTEYDRIFGLIRNTLLLVTGTELLALPLGSLLGFLVFRTDLPGRRWLRSAMIVSMFVPLPLLTSAWQSLLSGGSVPSNLQVWTPWSGGLRAAIAIHAVAALPWIVWLSGHGFVWVERSAEEDALITGGAFQALRQVTLPGATAALVLAAIWIAVQTSAEITVTDMLLVRTFAEEVYTQFSRPDPGFAGGAELALSRALAAAVPPALLGSLFLTAILLRQPPHLPALLALPDERPIYRLRAMKLPALLLTVTVIGGVTFVPFASLLEKLGAVPPDWHWSADVAITAFRGAWTAQRDRLFESLLWSLAVGGLCTGFAILTCLAIRNQGRLVRCLLVFLLLALWVMPAPVLGLGLKEAIDGLLELEERLTGSQVTVLRTLLYDGPSPLPVMWATGLRFLPVAFVLLAPVVQRLPRGSIDAARTDGAPWHLLIMHAVLPPLLPAAGRSILVVTALTMGELGASRLVQTPGGQSFAQEIFMQMHYGVNNHLAAMCLQLAAVVLVLMFAMSFIPLRARRESAG